MPIGDGSYAAVTDRPSQHMTTTLHIRRAADADADALRAVLAACGLSDRGLLAAGSRYWLAEQAGAPVGAVGMEYGAGAALLRSAAVLATQRGQRIGEALVRTALADAEAEGAQVYLFSTGAGPYWQRLGFVEVPVPELLAALPDAPQVHHFAAMGWLPTEVAWRLET